MKKKTQNPYLPGWEYVPDGEPKLFDGRVYIYGSHDEARGETYCTGDYVCWSAPADDLASWSFEGVIYRREDDPSYYGKEDILYFAPDVEKGTDGRYYLYYFSSQIEKIGVAVCSTPAGHYQYYGDVRFENGDKLTSDCGYGLTFDPAVLSDDSGNWLYYGFGLQERKDGFPESGYKGGFVARLKDDMLTIAEEPVQTIPGKMQSDETEFEGHAFLEASSIRHYGKWFYLIYSSELGHELCYAISEYPNRGFRYGGTIVSNGDVGLDGRTEEDAVGYLGNNHGGLLAIDEKYYIFYHRHTHGIQYSRQGCIEPVERVSDGSITQAEITSQGADGTALPTRREYSTHLACYLRSGTGILHYSSRVHWNEEHPYIAQENEQGVATLQNQYIYNLRSGAVCGFKYLQFDGGEDKISIRIRGDFRGKVGLFYDKPNGEAMAIVNVVPGMKWHWMCEKIEKVHGKHALYFRFHGIGSCDFDAFIIEGELL